MSDPRSSLRAFADLAGRPMREWQERALALLAAVTVVVAGRGMGKTRTLATFAAWFAFRESDRRILIVSASEASARRLLAEVRAIVGVDALRGSVVDEQAGLVRLSNGSEIRSVPSSEKAIRGAHVDLLLVDEAAFVSDDLLLSAAFPTTVARGGKIVLASSAGIAAGAFYDLAQQGLVGSENTRTHRWVAKAAGGDADAPWITPSLIARERAALGPLRFSAEFEAQFATGADSLFSAAALDRVTCDYETPELADLRGPARALGGMDWGATNDRSVLVAIGRFGLPGERLFGVRCVRRWPAGHPLPDVISEILDSPAAFDTLTAETNGLGQPCAQQLFRGMLRRRPEVGGGRRPRVVSWSADQEPDLFRTRKRPPRERVAHPPFVTRKVAYHVTAASKAATYSALRLLVDRQLVLIPSSAEELRRELLMLKVTLTEGGTEKIEADTGHDDIADAFCTALGPYKSRSGEWRTRLGDLAASRREIPGQVLASDSRAEYVETGGGLVVPASPAWLSVAGAELTGELSPAPAPPKRLTPVQVEARSALTAALADIPTNGGSE